MFGVNKGKVAGKKRSKADAGAGNREARLEREAQRSRDRRKLQGDLIAKLDLLVDTSDCVRDHRSTLSSGSRLCDVLHKTIVAIKLVLKNSTPKNPREEEQRPANRRAGDDLIDPDNPQQVLPKVLTAGLQSSKSIGIFALNLSARAEIVEWNKGMEAVSLPAGIARRQQFPSFVEHIGPNFFGTLHSFCDQHKTSLVGECRANSTLRLVKIERDHDAETNVWTYRPVPLNSMSVVQADGRKLVLFTSDLKGSLELDVVPPRDERYEVMDGTWNYTDNWTMTNRPNDPNVKEMTPLDLYSAWRDEGIVLPGSNIHASWYEQVRKSIGNLVTSSVSTFGKVLMAHFNTASRSNRPSIKVHGTFQLPAFLGGYRFPWVSVFSARIDGVIRKLPNQKNQAVAIYPLRTDSSRVNHAMAICFTVWYFRTEDDFEWLKSAEREMRKHLLQSAASTPADVSSPGPDEKPLKARRAEDCYLMWRRDMYISGDGNHCFSENWLWSATASDPGRKISYEFIKVGPRDMELTVDCEDSDSDNDVDSIMDSDGTGEWDFTASSSALTDSIDMLSEGQDGAEPRIFDDFNPWAHAGSS